MMMRTMVAVALVAGMLWPGMALAEDVVDKDLVQTKEASEAADDQADGWHFHLDLSGSFNLSHNRAVVDKPSGVSIALGGGFGTGLLFLSGPHEWSLSLGWKFGLARTPDLGTMTKSQDEFFLQTRYLYSFPKVKWLGVFAKFRMESALLPGWVVVLTDTDVTSLNYWGTVVDSHSYVSGDKVNLTSSFSPLLLKEKAGLMATPVDRKEVKVQVDLGLGSHQLVLFDDNFRIADDSGTPEMELRLLRPYTQIGVAMEARISGTPHEVLEYAAGAALMQPFYTSIDSTLEGGELLNVRIDGLLRFKLVKYVMLDLTLDARHYPLVVDKWQVTTNLLITFHYEAFAKHLAKPEPAAPAAP